MRKNLFFNSNGFRFLIISLAFIFAFAYSANAQCVSSYAAPGPIYSPGSTFLQTNAMGSGTYFLFNVQQGNIYSFFLADPATPTVPTATAPVTGNDWVMTLSGGSGITSYNNSLTPLENSYTGGAGTNCGLTNQVTSTDWYATYTGTIQVNLGTSTNGTNCLAYVPTQGSAVINYKECVTSIDPGPGDGADGLWNVDAFSTTDLTLPYPVNYARYGYYIDSTSDLEFATDNYYPGNGNPTYASDWIGCSMPPENFVIRARRQGFPCGLYTFLVNFEANGIAIYLNGNLLFSQNSTIGNPTTVGNTNGYALGPNDIVEIRNSALCGNHGVDVTLVPQTVAPETLTETDASCRGVDNGSITVTSGGLVGPFTYSANGSPPQSSNTFLGLQGGTSYLIGVISSNGCTDTASITIGNTYTTSIDTTFVSNISCYAAGDGEIVVQGSGGTAPYEYSNGGTLYLPSDTFTGLTAGTYIIVAKDAKGCIAFTEAKIVQPSQLDVQIDSVTNVLCGGGNAGDIYITPKGGTPGYTYLWSPNNATTQNNTGIPAGSYAVTVSDSRGCTATNGATITQPYPVSLNIALFNNPLCHNDSSGSILLTANGGVPPYSYLWSDGSSSQDIDSIPAGTYMATVTDNSGCHESISQTLINPPALTSALTASSVPCSGASSDTATVSADGGTPPYTYNWSNGLNGTTVYDLPGGPVCVTVVDYHECSVTACTIIFNTAPLAATGVVKNALCFGDTSGSVILNVTGGSPAYNFNWSNGATTENIINVDSGYYSVTISDSRSCLLVDSFVISQPTLVTTSAIVTQISCFGKCNGGIITDTYGGTPPYSLNWSNGVTSAFNPSLCPGTYTLSITDANGCPAASIFNLLEPAQLTVALVSNNPSCYGSCDGAVAAVPSGGTTPYEYLWNNFITDSSQDGACAGRYTVILTDSNGCHLSDSTDLIQPSQIVVTGTVTPVSCNSTDNGAIDVSVTGGSGNYTYAWSSGQTTENIIGVSVGADTLTVTDSHGCTQTAVFEVTQYPGLHTNASLSSPRCASGNDGFISVVTTGGIQPYTYEWNTTPPQQGATATGLVPGTYTLTVTDSIGCSAAISDTLSGPLPITITTSLDSSRCFIPATGKVVAYVTGGDTVNNVYTYTLNGIVQGNNTFTGLAAGNYLLLVTDVNGCQGRDSFNIGSSPPVTVSLAVSDQVILTGMQTQLLTSVVSDTNILAYIWSPITIDSADVFSYSGCTDTSDCSAPYVSPPFTTTFSVTVMDADSCYASDTLTVYVKNEAVAFIPNAFTPNGDNLNDRFEFAILGANSVDVSIFNRWGELVFHNPAQANGTTGTDGWDGTLNGKEEPAGTYVYQMKVTYFNDDVKNLAGTITIIR